MESLRVFRLPCDFKPVARICAEIERGFLTEMASFMKLQEKSYITVLGDMEQDTIDIKDDVEFIVNLQNEFGIADSTPQEMAEWYVAFTTMRNIENYNKCKIEYDKYTNTLTNCHKSALAKILYIKNEILTMYHYYIFGMSLDNVKDFLASCDRKDFYDADYDLQWSCQGSHICRCS